MKKILKKMSLDEYIPINYKTWILGDNARKGVNIKRLGILNSDELRLWEALEQYQDSRNDAGHGEIATYLAVKLLPYYPKAIREIVVPTTMGHDIGFFGEDSEAWQKAVQAAQKSGNLRSLNADEKRMPHQIKGAEMVLEIFKKVGYPRQEYCQECPEIIKDHDTRHNPTTPSGRVMWDADYIWRVTLPCNKIYLFDKGITDPYEILKRAENSCLNTKPPHNLEGVAKQIARIELANTILFRFPEDAEKVLKSKYEKEFGYVKSFGLNNK